MLWRVLGASSGPQCVSAECFSDIVCQGLLCGDDVSFGIAGVNKSRKQGSLHEGHQ